MDRMLYVAMSGAKETFMAQMAANNNLANANTTGFLADLQQFRSMPVFGPGHPTRVYALSERPAIDFDRGGITFTGEELDVAVHGSGWIAVQAADGNEAYTRRGDLKVDPNGLLTTGNGLPVMGNAGPIAIPPYDKIDVGDDGTISIRPQGQQAEELAVIDRIKLVKPPLQDLIKGDDGLLRTRTGKPVRADAAQRVTNGALEASNVNVVEEMVNLIELSRRFEMQVKMMKTTEEMASSAASLVRPV